MTRIGSLVAALCAIVVGSSLAAAVGVTAGGKNTAEPLARWSGIARDFRPYAGARYLTTDLAKVREGPDDATKVVADVPRLRLVYAEDTADKGWVRIRGAGTRIYPDRFESMGVLGLREDGKLDLRDMPDRDDYFPETGYVRRDGLLPLDVPSVPLPLSEARLTPVPALWADLGVPDQRFQVGNPDAYPFNAVVQVQVRWPGATAVCSGFFFLDRLTVATAGHCFRGTPKLALLRKSTDFQVTVLVGQGKDQEVVPATLRSRVDNDETGVDFGLLALAHAPAKAVGTLEFSDGSEFVGQEVVPIVIPGFPADMASVLPGTMIAKRCSVVVSTINITRTKLVQSGLPFNDFTVGASDCVIWHGDSGAPVLVYDHAKARWKVIGIDSLGRDENFFSVGVQGGGLSLTPEALVKVQGKATALWKQYNSSSALPSDSKAWFTEASGADYIMLQGVASLYVAVDRDTVGFGAIERFSTSDLLLDLLYDGAGHGNEVPPFAETLWDKAVIQKDSMWFSQATGKDDYDTVRLYCAQECKDDVLDPKWHVDLSEGDEMHRSTLGTRPFMFFGFTSMLDSVANTATVNFQLPLVRNDKSKVGFLVVGGDAFLINKDSALILKVIRGFMNRSDVMPERVPFVRWTCGPCEHVDASSAVVNSYIPEQSTLRGDPLQGTTPPAVPGARTVTVNQAFLMQRNLGAKLVTIAATEEPFGLPGSVSLPASGSPGSFDDRVQSDLSLAMEAATGGDKTRPILVYCHHEQCWLSYNAALRIMKLGYVNVSWMRDGLQGWIMRGYPLAKARATAELVSAPVPR